MCTPCVSSSGFNFMVHHARVFAAITLVSLFVKGRLEAYPTLMCDLDDDGKATVMDILRINGHLTGDYPLPDPYWWFTDTDLTEFVDTNDVALVRDAALGIIGLVPVVDANFDGMPDHIGNKDYDGDDLINAGEVQNHSDILDPDTDDDGFLDGDEVARGSDPTDPVSMPFGTIASSVASYFNPLISDHQTGSRQAASRLRGQVELPPQKSTTS